MAAAQLSIPVTYLIDRTGANKIALQPDMILGRETGISAQGVSRQHCAIRFHGEHFYVADMSSTYGTFLNKRRIEPNQWQKLSLGDSLRIGTLDLQLEYGAVTGPKPARTKPVAMRAEAAAEPEIAEREVDGMNPDQFEPASIWLRVLSSVLVEGQRLIALFRRE